mgnify:CR=1 FL=1
MNIFTEPLLYLKNTEYEIDIINFTAGLDRSNRIAARKCLHRHHTEKQRRNYNRGTYHRMGRK